MNYIDCYLAPVPAENRNQYEELAKVSAEVVKDYGALRVVECWLDESGPDASSYHGEETRSAVENYGDFFAAAGARKGETVVMSFIEWPDKSTRDIGMEKFTGDARMQFGDRPPVFDGKRLIAGGFIPMLYETREL